MPSPLLSIILPNFNEGARLHQTIASLAQTTCASYEVIVVDNGCSDGSSDFLRENVDERITLIREPRRLGVVGARHCGAAQASGDVLVFADAHLIFPQNWDQPMLDTLSLPGVALVGPAVCNTGDLQGPYICGSVWANAALDVQHLDRPATQASYEVAAACGGCQMLTREQFQRTPYDSGMVDWGMEDHELCVRLWMLGRSVRVVPSVLVQHYFREFVSYARWENVTYNKLRAVFAHLGPARVTRCIEAIAVEPGFSAAFSRIKASDIFDRRAVLDDIRVHDDDWYFRRFGLEF